MARPAVAHLPTKLLLGAEPNYLEIQSLRGLDIKGWLMSGLLLFIRQRSRGSCSSAGHSWKCFSTRDPRFPFRRNKPYRSAGGRQQSGRRCANDRNFGVIRHHLQRVAL